MDSREIERQLRLPAPDEPAILPELILPAKTMGPGTVRIGFRRRGEPRLMLGPSPRLLLLLLLALLAAVVTTVAGALRLELLTNPLDPYRGFDDHRVQLDYPAGWVKLTPDDPRNQSGASTVLLLSSAGVHGCTAADVEDMAPPMPVSSGQSVEFPYSEGGIQGVEDRVLACVIQRRMTPGEIRVVVTAGVPQRVGMGPIESFDPTAWFGPSARPDALVRPYVPTVDDGWNRAIDGMPAKLVVTPGSPFDRADEIRTWAVYEPGNAGQPWFIRAYLRGPDLDGLRTQADAVALSLRFATRPVDLDVARRDETVAAAIDDLDRELRQLRGSRLYGCFPRSAGSSDVVLRDGNLGPLPMPVPATCTTSAIEPTLLRMWQVTLTVSWPAGDGYAAGELRTELLVDPAARGFRRGGFTLDPSVTIPGNAGPLPSPLVGDLAIPVGALARVLTPGIRQSGSVADSPIQALYADPDDRLMDRLLADVLPGTRLYVIGGPRRAAGTDWYLVEYDLGASGPGDLGWVPAAWDGRPLVEAVEPACPQGEPTLLELVYLEPAERLLCFGDRELTLEPVIAATTDFVGRDSPSGEPAWLDAWATRWRLYGADGPDGVEPPLTIAIPPALGDSIPTGRWLTVRGHFDDSASPGCRTRDAEYTAGIAEWPAFQELVCRELFVVTSFEEGPVP